MKTYKAATLALVLSFVFAAALSAQVSHAQSDNGVLGTGINMGLSGGTSTATSSNTSLNVNANASLDAQSSANSNGGDNNGDQKDQNGNSANMNDESSSSASVSSFVMTRADIGASGSSDVNSQSQDINKDPSSVSTNDDLKAYVASGLKSDDHFQDVDSSSDHVSVGYKERAHLFGFIPVTVHATGTVNSNGDVSVRYPWYRFLMSTNKGDIEARIKADMQAMGWNGNNGSTSNGGASATFSTTAQARLIGSIYSAMRSANDSNANVSGSSSVNGNASANQ